MYKPLIDGAKNDFNRISEFLKNELAQIRSGRASPSLVEDIRADAYGTKMKIKELAAVLVPDPKSLIIQVWDRALVQAVAKAIEESHLGLSPSIEGQNIKLALPPLVEERKKELIRLLNEKLEQGRIRIRRGRDEIWHKIQDLEKDKKISEDDKFRAKDKLQEIVDEYNEKIKEIGQAKEREISG